MVIEARIPVRIDFGGPWTDTPEFYENEPEGGATLNAAIVPLLPNAMGQYRQAYVRGTLTTGGSLLDAKEIIVSGPSGPLREKLVRGIGVSYEAGIPSSGLGTSAALNALWLGLIKGINEDISSPENRQLIAEKAHRIERELGIIGGKQDQYAAVFARLTNDEASYGSEALICLSFIRMDAWISEGHKFPKVACKSWEDL